MSFKRSGSFRDYNKTIQFLYGSDFYEAVVDVDYYTDFNYGEDADGKRGINRTRVEKIQVNSLVMVDEDGENHDIDPSKWGKYTEAIAGEIDQ